MCGSTCSDNARCSSVKAWLRAKGETHSPRLSPPRHLHTSANTPPWGGGEKIFIICSEKNKTENILIIFALKRAVPTSPLPGCSLVALPSCCPLCSLSALLAVLLLLLVDLFVLLLLALLAATFACYVRLLLLAALSSSAATAVLVLVASLATTEYRPFGISQPSTSVHQTGTVLSEAVSPIVALVLLPHPFSLLSLTSSGRCQPSFVTSSHCPRWP